MAAGEQHCPEAALRYFNCLPRLTTRPPVLNTIARVRGHLICQSYQHCRHQHSSHQYSHHSFGQSHLHERKPRLNLDCVDCGAESSATEPPTSDTDRMQRVISKYLNKLAAAAAVAIISVIHRNRRNPAGSRSAAATYVLSRWRACTWHTWRGLSRLPASFHLQVIRCCLARPPCVVRGLFLVTSNVVAPSIGGYRAQTST